MHRFVGVIEYGDRLHVIAAVLSATRYPVSPALARQYMSRLEALVSRIVAREYGFVDIDAYTYIVSAAKFTKSVRGNISTDTGYSIARLYIPYERLHHLLPHMLCSLYSSRCKYDGHKTRHSMCLLAQLFCEYAEQ